MGKEVDAVFFHALQGDFGDFACRNLAGFHGSSHTLLVLPHHLAVGGSVGEFCRVIALGLTAIY